MRTHEQRTARSFSTYLAHASSSETPFRSFQASLSNDVIRCKGQQIWLKGSEAIGKAHHLALPVKSNIPGLGMLTSPMVARFKDPR